MKDGLFLRRGKGETLLVENDTLWRKRLAIVSTHVVRLCLIGAGYPVYSDLAGGQAGVLVGYHNRWQ